MTRNARAVGFLDSVDRGDGWMIQRREHARLALETRDTLGVAREFLGQHLDCDAAAELRIGSLVHVPHAAGADVRGDLVVCESAADHES